MFGHVSRTRPRGMLARLLFRLVIVLLWLLVCGLGVKLVSTYYVRVYIPQHNPYILNCKKDIMPGSNLGDVTAAMVITPCPTKWTLPDASGTPDWYIPRKNETPAEEDARHALLLTLREDERMRLAICHGEVVLRFDRNGSLLKAYGDWYKCRKILAHDERFFPAQELASTLKRISAEGKAAHVALSISLNQSSPRTVDFYFLPDPQTGDVFVSAKLEYEYLAARSTSLPADSRWEIDGLKYKKDFATDTEGIHIETNRYGFRAPNVSVPKPAGLFRILCIGGSATFEGCDNKHSYPTFLEEHLKRLFPGKAIEVINCGVEGIRTSSQFLLLPDYLELEPDLVVACEGTVDAGNEIQRECQAYKQAPWLFRFFALEDSSIQQRFWPPEEVLRDWIKESTIVDLDCLRCALTKRGIHFALASNMYPACDRLPRVQSQYYEWKSEYTARLYGRIVGFLNDETKRFCARNGLAYIPLAENMSNSIEYLYDLCHMDWPGSNVKAFIIAQTLRDYLAPALSK